MSIFKDNALSLIQFLNEGSSAFHVVLEAEKQLAANGFSKLNPGDVWNLQRGGKYFLNANNSSVFAFIVGKGNIAQNGFRIIAAHTDSPTIKIKPNPVMNVYQHFMKLNIETYGGGIWYTWFDRPLGIAGRVSLKSKNPLSPQNSFVRIDKPVAIIPHLAIHMNRGVNDGNSINAQKDLLPLIALNSGNEFSTNALHKMLADELQTSPDQILDYELNLFETHKGELVGANEEMISMGKIDNQAMVHAGLKALLSASNSEATQMVAFFDNEEVGSGSKQGAHAPVLKHIIERIVMQFKESDQDYYRALHHSFLISADMAHSLHPNYTEKYDPTNLPVMNNGPVIKIAANQKYTSDSDSAASFAQICETAGIPYQRFVNRADMAGGSTLGNIATAHLNIRMVDVGTPMLAMHSIRELSGVVDHTHCINAFTKFYEV